MYTFAKYLFYHLCYWINLYLVLIIIAILLSTILTFILLKLGFKHYVLNILARPNDYPFNNFLDRFLPLVTLFIPFIIVIIGFSDILWISRLSVLILFHILFVIPIIFYWSTLRRWNNETENFAEYKSWTHPRLYKQIALALIYPYIWGFYFSILRYLRLGNTLDLTVITTYFTKDMFCLIFLIPCIICIIVQSLKQLNRLRNYLWDALNVLIYSFHIKFLVNRIYFVILEKLFKFNHLWFSAISLGGPVYYKTSTNFYSWWRRSLSYLLFHPYWFTIMMFICLFLELVINKGQIYFGLYILFFYPLIRSIVYLLYSFGNSQWVLDCCLSDYISCRWDLLHYPQAFWDYFDEAEYFYGFELDFTKAQLDSISKSKSKCIWQARKKVSKNVHDSAVFLRVVGKRKFRVVLAASFKSRYSIRWGHTNIILENNVWHPATSLFGRTFLQKVSLLNNSWRHLYGIQKTEAMFPETLSTISSQMFLKPLQNCSIKKKYFIKHIEDHTSDHFVELQEKNVLFEPFDPTKHANLPEVIYPQAQPDLVLDARKTEFKDSSIRFLDQKSNHPGTGKNKILSNISEKRYCSTLNEFLLEYQKTNKISWKLKF